MMKLQIVRMKVDIEKILKLDHGADIRRNVFDQEVPILICLVYSPSNSSLQ